MSRPLAFVPISVGILNPFFLVVIESTLDFGQRRSSRIRFEKRRVLRRGGAVRRGDHTDVHPRRGGTIQHIHFFGGDFVGGDSRSGGGVNSGGASFSFILGNKGDTMDGIRLERVELEVSDLVLKEGRGRKDFF